MGFLTTHVLDTAQGTPGAGIPVSLYRVDNEYQQVKSLVTNADGRTDEPLLNESEFAMGTWELRFQVAQYFQSNNSAGDEEAAFLDEINIRFTISKDDHYHVPLLASPWSYSTYRGS